MSATSTAIPLSPAGRWLAFIVLVIGGLLPSVDFFIVNVSLPSIHAAIGANPAELQLVVSGYAATYAVFLITGGRLGDLYGRRRLYLIGMAGFLATNALCGLAVTPLQLVIGRIMQGIAAAVLVPQVLGSIRALFPSEAELAKALSVYGVMMGLAASIGQFAGGALVEWSPFELGWRAVFLSKLPVGIPLAIAAWAMMPETSSSRRQRLDTGGALLVSLTLACLVLPLSEGRQQGWPAWTFIMLAAVPFLAAAFLWFEARLATHAGSPLLDLSLLRIPSFRRGVVVGTLFFFTTSFYVLFAIYEQEGYGTDPLYTGLAILPYGVGLFVGPLVTAPLARLRPWLLTIGMAIQVTGYAAIALVIGTGLRRLARDAVRAARRFRSGHRLSAAVQFGTRRRGAAPGWGCRRCADHGLADRRCHQCRRYRQPVLWRARPRCRSRPLRPRLRHRASSNHDSPSGGDAAVDPAPATGQCR